MEVKKYCVYIHKNKINGKVYIGQTCQNVNDRWMNGLGYLHKNKDGSYTQPAFAKAILKYTFDGFEHIIVANELNIDEANELEIKLIKKYKANNPLYGYNISQGGNGNKGHKLTDEQKKLIGERTKEALSNKTPCNLGKHLSEETKNKISKSRKGKCCGKENHNYGKPLSDETKVKLSKSIKEHWDKYGHPNKGKKMSDEQKEKISKSRKGKYIGANNKMSKRVLQIDLESGEIINEFAGVQEAARITGAIATKISACCLGKRNKHFGYAWKHKE